jgi:hypothetical protein
MHTVFLACLIGGAVTTALFAFLGFAGGAAHAGHVHLGHGAHHIAPAAGHAGHAASSGHHAAHPATQHGSPAGRVAGAFGWTLSWFSPLTIAAAALWFGGIGLIVENSALVVLFAIVAAVIGAAVIRLAMNVFIRASSPPLFESAEGALATVNAAIRPDAPGEVIYTLEGLHRSLPARSIDGSAIPRGVTVVIARREAGIAWVERLDPLEEFTLNTPG